MLEDEWNIKDTVLRRAGENYGKKWSMQVNGNPYGMYFATVQVGDKVEHCHPGGVGCPVGSSTK